MASTPYLHRRRYRQLAFWGTLALLIGVGLASVTGVRYVQGSKEAIEGSYQAIGRIEMAELQLRAAEANARGYRITGDESYRDAYLQAVPLASAAARRMLEESAPGSPEHARAAQLHDAVLQRLDEIQRLYLLQETSGIEAALAATDPTLSLQQSRQIAALAQGLRSAEARRLRERQAVSQLRGAWLAGFVVLGTLLSIGLLVGLTRSLTAENRRVRQLEREARDAVATMQATIAQRDRLSEQRHQLSRYASLLQSCANRDEIMRLTASTLQLLIPQASGQCYVLKASNDLYESAATFGSRVVSSGDLLQSGQCWALRRGQPHYVPGGRGGMPCEHIDPGTPRDDVSYICLPLTAHGTAIGLLHVSAPASGDPDDRDADIVASVAEQLGLALANLHLREKLEMQSLRDPLTGLFNRRYLEENLARELYRCERRGLPLSVLMLDVDRFKQFNDTHGHAAGDALLAHVGRVIAGNVRAEDMACRYGGEEFTLVLPEADAATAHQRAHVIRRALETATLIHLRQPLGPVTASIGLAVYPDDGTTSELLLQVADAWLYRAKAEGRNRVLPDPA